MSRRSFSVSSISKHSGALMFFEVDPADRGRQHLAEPDHVLRIRRVDLDVEHIDVGEALEQHPLAFHHRLRCFRTDVAQPEHGRTVRDYGHQVAARRIAVHSLHVFFDLPARLGHAGCVRQGQVSLCDTGLRGDDFDLPGSSLRVIAQRRFLPNLGHGFPLQFDVLTSVGGPFRVSCRALTGPARGSGARRISAATPRRALSRYSKYPAFVPASRGTPRWSG